MRTWIEISAAALRHNLGQFQRVVGPGVKIAPVIKANAYGHGMLQVAQALKNSPIWGFNVAYGSEAKELRTIFGGRILAMSFWEPEELPTIVRHKIEVAVWDREALAAVADAARRTRLRAQIHLKLDCGTTRIGFLPNQLNQLARQLKKQSMIDLVGIFSHLAHSEEYASQRTSNQIALFERISQPLTTSTIERHLACTASTLRYPTGRFQFVRVGIGMFGIWPSSSIARWMNKHNPWFTLHPVMHWKTRLMQVKKVPARTSVGYGGSFVTKRPSRIGIIPVGYSDGLDRNLSNRGWVIVHGKAAPIIGRVSMNLTLLDLTNIPSGKRGSHVTIIGPGVRPADIGLLVDRIDYEITSRINPLIPRCLV